MRWTVARTQRRSTFATRALAESFRADLLSAARRGEAFDLQTGLPISLSVQEDADVSWYEHACAYVDMKWARAAGNSRRSIADALATVTPALLADGSTPPNRKLLRKALYAWAFNTSARKAGGPPEDCVGITRWLERHTLPMSSLDDPVVIRRALDTLASKQDGTPTAANTFARKRAIFFNALEYAVERDHLPTNPLRRVKWTAPKVADAVDPRILVDRRRAEAILAAAEDLPTAMGPRMVAFYACIYYAAMRPAEVADLRASDIKLPPLVRSNEEDREIESGEWGELLLSHSSPALSTAWTEAGTRRESRQLKHRAKQDVRPVPCHPRLVELLRRHLDEFGTAPDGRLFRSRYHNRPLSESTVWQVWHKARAAALSPQEAASALARRPYDLRHACVTTWLNAGVDPAQVAEWAGHSVAVLLRVYVRCIAGRDEVAKQRIERALQKESNS
ncbi:tyrosine-type recombinase/integrase [Actinopolymorpha sp. NPDC004070]|uniref:tyrosine-type recombinase/integrase n=1 Tax=Actinopolymorpha sp. NPDC004070 TaxID=3154548 RepID=UPI0033BD3888